VINVIISPSCTDISLYY